MRVSAARQFAVVGWIALLAASCAEVNPPATQPISSDPSLEHSLWVSKCLDDMRTVKVGSTRGNLLKVFEQCGGISQRGGAEYFYRGCQYFLVDVRFESVENPQDKGTEYPTDKITEISAPFLGYPPMD